jgi:eukaryotic-like serine/threonine-protein kinase
MFGAQHEIKIADLGLAKRLPGKGIAPLDPSIRADQLTMLRGDNAIQGTPAYMAPEMAISPDKVDLRADLYALGVTAYELLTGKLPFMADDNLTLLMKHVTHEVVPPRTVNPAISPVLETVVLRLLQKKPEHRYQNPRELTQALSKVPL